MQLMLYFSFSFFQKKALIKLTAHVITDGLNQGITVYIQRLKLAEEPLVTR